LETLAVTNTCRDDRGCADAASTRILNESLRTTLPSTSISAGPIWNSPTAFGISTQRYMSRREKLPFTIEIWSRRPA
jgi:hypothetical protein